MTLAETKIRKYLSLSDSLAKMGGGAGLALFGTEIFKGNPVFEIVFLLAALVVVVCAMIEPMFRIPRTITDGKGGRKND